MSVVLNQELCIRCGVCKQLCNMRVFGEDAAGNITVKDDNCFHCGHCYAVCPVRAITLDGNAPDAFPAVSKAALTDLQQDMLFKSCRSVRWYDQKPVTEADLTRALELANYAATARNAREVQWTVINGREKIVPLVHDVADTMRGTDSPYVKMVEAVDKGLDPILRGAPCVIMAHAKPWGWAETDCAINATWLSLVLHSMGIGSCWCGILITAGKARSLPHLPLPEGHVAYAGLMVGYPKANFISLPPRTAPQVNFI